MEMTLDEAIKHAEEVAKQQEEMAWEAQLQEEYRKIKSCKKCSENHHQLAEWLKDYKRLKEQEPKWIPVSEKLPEKNEWYSCTVNLSDFHYVTMDLYFKNGKWLDNRRIEMFHCYEVYGFGKSTEKHKLDYSELLEDFDWTERVVAWMPLQKPFDPQEDKEKE